MKVVSQETSECVHGFYVVRRIDPDTLDEHDPRRRHLGGAGLVVEYLHNDGEWRSSTLNEGQRTGYYKTREDAEKTKSEAKMKADELDDGQYFKNPGNVIGRKLNDGLYYFDLESTKGSINKSIKICDWKNPVEPIDFQTAILLLTKQCLDNPQPVEGIDEKNIIPAENLVHGQFFMDNDGYVGRRFMKPEDVVVYLTENNCSFMDDALSVANDPVIPLTLHQAILYPPTP